MMSGSLRRVVARVLILVGGAHLGAAVLWLCFAEMSWFTGYRMESEVQMAVVFAGALFGIIGGWAVIAETTPELGTDDRD